MKTNSNANPLNLKSARSQGIAFLWDESFLWGLMAYKALKINGLPFELIRSEDIKRGKLKNYAMLFVPGGWATNKLKSLGDKGCSEIKGFVKNGGSYLGFCGGAGLATIDCIGLLDVKRKPTKERVPSFSGRIKLNTSEHSLWQGITEPAFHVWWPSQFLIEDNSLKILATYGDAMPDSFSSDLNVGDIGLKGDWPELENTYRINLNPERLINDPAVIEGPFGNGRVILSLIHFDTPDDANGAIVLKNLWEYLTERRSAVSSQQSIPLILPSQGGIAKSELEELEKAVEDLISLGMRNFLWFWRNPMLLQWRRGVRGLEYCTLYVMIKEIAEILKKQRSALSSQRSDLNRIKELLIPFTEKAGQLLILERHAMRNGHITYERCDDREIQKIRTELFSNSKSHGGLFKELIDGIDDLLYDLIQARNL